MNPQGQQQQAGAAQARPPPMYRPDQIRNLPLLTDEEKSKYEQGLNSLWSRMQNSSGNNAEQIAARNKIVDFSKMLITKIQQRRSQAQTQAQARPQGAQPANPQAGAQQTQQGAQQRTQAAQGNAGATGAGATAAQTATTQAAASAAATVAAIQRPKIPDHLIQHVSKMTFRPPVQLAEKSSADAAKWIEEMKDKYARALLSMESSKSKINAMDKLFNERNAAGNPFQGEELKKYHMSRDQQLKFHTEAQKWVDSVRRQQETLQGVSNQNGQNTQSTAATQQAGQKAGAAGRTQSNGQIPPAIDVAKAQQLATARAAANGTPTTAQNRPGANAAQQANAAGQNQVPKQEQAQPPPVNTALAATAAQNQALAAGRVQTPQSATAATAGGPGRPLSHQAAMVLANQRAASTPNSAALPGQQQGAGTPTGVGANNGSQGAAGAATQQQQQQQQQGHPHAHPSQQAAPLQSKMPIQKQLPERATAIPQGVTVGGGVGTGRPTMSQGSGTLGGVMNQPAVAKIPAYNNDAEGDHVLSKKKLDELVRQVCGATSEGQDGNLLTPEVEEVCTSRKSPKFATEEIKVLTNVARRVSLPWQTRLSTMCSMQRAVTRKNADRRCSKFAIFNLCWSEPTTSAFQATLQMNFERSARSSLLLVGLPR